MQHNSVPLKPVMGGGSRFLEFIQRDIIINVIFDDNDIRFPFAAGTAKVLFSLEVLAS